MAWGALAHLSTSVQIGGSASVLPDIPVTQRDAVDRRTPRPAQDRSSVSDLLEITVGARRGACRSSTTTAARWLHRALPDAERGLSRAVTVVPPRGCRGKPGRVMGAAPAGSAFWLLT